MRQLDSCTLKPFVTFQLILSVVNWLVSTRDNQTGGTHTFWRFGQTALLRSPFWVFFSLSLWRSSGPMVLCVTYKGLMGTSLASRTRYNNMVALSHASHLTFEPIILFQLLDLFPDESGQKNKKSRVIPFLPGTIKFDTINLIIFFYCCNLRKICCCVNQCSGVFSRTLVCVYWYVKNPQHNC